MADFKVKLRRLQGLRPMPGGGPALAAPPGAGSASEAQVSGGLPGPQLVSGRDLSAGAPPPWQTQATAHGPVHLVAQQRDHSFAHGTVCLAGCREVQAAHLALLALNVAWHDVDLSRLLYLDTETTGLSGGAGTLPFVVGLGYFSAEGWRTEQLILERPGGEAPLLRHLAQHLEQASALVTYNGKSFDWPLLKMRFILNRVPLPPLQQHLDLLHCVRRIYKRRKQPLRLINLEQRLLGFFREGDIDGADIPERYFAYLRGAAPSTLEPIITHNAHDLAAMAAVLSAVSASLDNPDAHYPPSECLSIAELQLRTGQLLKARSLAQHSAAAQPVCGARPAAARHPAPLCAQGEGPSSRPSAALSATHSLATPCRAQAYLFLAELYRKEKDFLGCRQALEAALQVSSTTDPLYAQLHLMLSKLYEHRLTDLAQAALHARHTAALEGEAGQRHRLARLQRKLAVQLSQPVACDGEGRRA
jgi:uncharacterized protein YprB with RNaseH-like and TPR domain